jgi:glycosyltransferase involved in cell wall biosynthesis
VKIAILGSRGFPSTYGGYETLVRHLAPFLVSRGHDVTVYGRREGPRLTPRTPDERAVRVVETPGVDSTSLSTLSYGLTSTVHAAARGGYDSCLVVNVANGFFLPALRAAGTHVAVNVDGIEWERDKWNAAGKAVFLRGARATARWAHEIIADSQAIQARWASEFGRTGVYIPYGATVGERAGDDLLRPLGLTPGRYLLAVARVVPENNVSLLLDAAADLGWEVVVVGSGADADPTVQRLTGLARRGEVHWLGHVNDQQLLRQLWTHSAVYWHGHSVGGTNPALLQAMAAGACVVAYDSSYNREVLEEHGAYARDAVELAGVLDRLLQSPQTRAQMARDALDQVAQRFTWDSVCAAYERALTPSRPAG